MIRTMSNVGKLEACGRYRLMLGDNVSVDDAIKYRDDYRKRYPQFKFILVRDAPCVSPFTETYIRGAL